MAVEQFNIQPSDGWVAVTSAGVNFIRIRASVDSHAFYVTCAADAPAETDPGYKVGPSDDDDFWCNVATTDLFYVRAINEQPNGNLITVFSIPS